MSDWQPIIFTGKAIIKTPTQTIEITPSEVEWETEIGSDNNARGADVEHTGIYCFEGGEVTWTAYKYFEATVRGGDVGVKTEIEVEVNNGELVPKVH